MLWRLNEGDRDILRAAERPSAVFWYRAGQSPGMLAGAAALTAVLAAIVVALVLGPVGLGVRWLTRETLAVVVSLVGVLWLIYVGWVFFKFLPGRNDRVVIGLRGWVRAEVDPLEAQVQALSEEQLRAKTVALKGRIAAGEPVEAIRAEAYACVREASRRARNHRQFECQLIGGRVLEDCSVAEMRTGEGKTIVCYMGNYLKVLQGLKVHLVTVNDYLVRRDAEFARPVFELLGVSVGFISAEMATFGPGAEVRRAAYECDITYGTNSEFGFDFLRDNMKHSVRDQVQGKLNYVVVDEVDSILIDEARTPLIISGPAHDDVTNYRVADGIAQMLIRKQQHANREMSGKIDQLEANPPAEARNNPKFRGALKKFRTDPLWLSSDEAEAIGHMQYFVVELDRKSAHMTEHGAKAAQAELGIGTFYDSKNMNWPHYIDNAVRAHLCYNKDKEYVIQEDKIVIVDEFTGRLMQGRQWSDGLHQAVEAKERVTIKEETQTLATVTLQNFFKMYLQVSGMTGTALTEADEFMKIYKLEVIAIPTNRAIRRVDYNDKIYKTRPNKFDAIVEEIRSYSQDGFPADPWSIYDEFRLARRRIAKQKSAPDADASLADMERVIDDALAAFKDGKGDENALHEAYPKLKGAGVGGRPVLVGTVSVENSEHLSQLLTRRHGIEHEVLNAKNHAREADIVVKAGQQHEVVRKGKKELHGNVTIATNMAGRGTDIVLGPGVAILGGLHVVGTERHESRRIDNQLRGRCGRQGDPGSSRFFLSLEDDLLRLFMGEWVLRMLALLGFEEGMAIEDKRLTRGIEKAQKKVEERNFGIRKNLLEYDEVMDYQRRTFYQMRQRVVEGRGLSDLIWEMIDQSVGDAVERYYDPKYAAICVAEWVGQNLGATIDAGKLDVRDFGDLCEQVRDLATGEVKGTIERTFGEYIDPDVEPDEWDVKGFIGWATHYGISLTQRQVRDGDADELREQIVNAAIDKIAHADLAPIQQYVDPLYAKSRLVRWAQDKFGVQIPLDDIAAAQRDDAERVISEQMRAAYKKREVAYPVQAMLEYSLQRGGMNALEVYQRVAKWVDLKYRLGWSYEHFVGKSPQQMYDELRALNEDFMLNGKLDAEIEQALQQHPGDAILTWAKERFGIVLESSPLSLEGDLRQQLKSCSYEMLRFELTQLERTVLLSTFDAVWKDHMYAMDLLRQAIGLRGYAERDPKIEYKREGTRLFNEMLSNVRERVTDLIFKVHLPPPPDAMGDRPAALASGPDAGPAYAGMQAQKADATNVGFSSRDQQAAMANQGEAAQRQTIRRAMPKVGRNDPCPCGSGKKYKSCHGKGAA